VNSKSNRFVSLTALVLVAGCHSAPPKPAAPKAAANTAAPAAPAAAPSAAQNAAPGKPGNAAAGSTVVTGKGATPPVPAAPVPERAAQQYAQALALMKSGRNTDAELEFKQLALSYPEFAGPDVNLGVLYLRASRYADAETALKAALARNPDNAIASDELGIVERKLGKFAEAEAAYQHAIAVEPNYAPAYLNLGVLYDLYLAEPQKALEQFEHYLTLAGDNKQVAGWVVELKKRVGAPAAPAAAPAAKKEPA
jgi:tetratricopeptide (TPR) repeat protein